MASSKKKVRSKPRPGPAARRSTLGRVADKTTPPAPARGAAQSRSEARDAARRKPAAEATPARPLLPARPAVPAPRKAAGVPPKTTAVMAPRKPGDQPSKKGIPPQKAVAPSDAIAGAKSRAVSAAKPKARTRPAPASAGPKPTGESAPLPEETLQDVGGPTAVPGLTEEDQIRAAKYLPRELPKRVFEEERFLFPETYGVNRIRLLVRDPEWIFAYWDVNAEAMRELARAIGERALALSRLTLRIVDPVSRASADILLPPGARWWYVRTDAARRTYRAELGVTLPSGEFRRIAESNTVVTPRVGPSAARAGRRMSYTAAQDIPISAAEAALAADARTDVAHEPWAPGSVDGASSPEGERTVRPGRPGASDTFQSEKGGASDTFRPGASDAFRR